MANTRKVLLSLHETVADRLSQEKNKSALIDALAAAHYGLTFESGSSASNDRQSILDSLKITSLDEADSTETDEVGATEAVVESTELPIVAPIEAAPAAVEPPAGADPTSDGTVSEPDFQPVFVAQSDFVPVVAPLDSVVPVSEVQPAQPQAVAVNVVEPLAEATPAIAEPVAEVAAEPVAETIEEPAEESAPRIDPATGLTLCPTCDAPMVTPICLNCL